MRDQNLWDGSEQSAEDFDASDIVDNKQIMSAAAYDLGTSMVLTIKNAYPRTFNSEPYVLLAFEEVPETTRLANTNLRRLVQLYGTSSSSWRGHQIRLSVTEIATGELAGTHMFVLDSPDRQLGESLKYQPSQRMLDLLERQNHIAPASEGAAAGKKRK